MDARLLNMMIVIRRLMIMFLLLMLAYGNLFAQEQSFIETRLTNFIKKIYDESEEIGVRFGNIPAQLKKRPNIRNMSFVRMPDGRGDGLCLVEIEGKNRRVQNVYVPFRVIKKTRVFVMIENGIRGDVIRRDSVAVRETNLSDRRSTYPSKLEDVVGKTLKRDVPEGTVITSQLLDNPVVIEKGEVVNIIAENSRLVVRAKGRALEKGKMGDSIRVKNTSSDREVYGKVVGDNAIFVSF
ncbi:MAG: flagellar basal body P-ring biosynthesis protein FlgA [Syntrophorhabdus sp. PtaU1.Bin002]|nr:MAG: flagellar basal body P-ring biosynthesis protein FlgA [Syntrophorhabdus sp. PtaB.Bin006]OPY73575.1 MAG: flagellar basal body P-ring biosynthesis protein FlgA [Syntrophorhabdus sp. PtaU1.Bin002]